MITLLLVVLGTFGLLVVGAPALLFTLMVDTTFHRTRPRGPNTRSAIPMEADDPSTGLLGGSGLLASCPPSQR